ncbi:hypothetical protein Lal_00047608, partial [Lupinus albus]
MLRSNFKLLPVANGREREYVEMNVYQRVRTLVSKWSKAKVSTFRLCKLVGVIGVMNRFKVIGK